MKGDMKGVINTLSSHLIDDTETVKGVFDEFKSEVRPTKARRAARVFNGEELEILRPDYGSAIDSIKKR